MFTSIDGGRGEWMGSGGFSIGGNPGTYNVMYKRNPAYNMNDVTPERKREALLAVAKMSILRLGNAYTGMVTNPFPMTTSKGHQFSQEEADAFNEITLDKNIVCNNCIPDNYSIYGSKLRIFEEAPELVNDRGSFVGPFKLKSNVEGGEYYEVMDVRARRIENPNSKLYSSGYMDDKIMIRWRAYSMGKVDGAIVYKYNYGIIHIDKYKTMIEVEYD